MPGIYINRHCIAIYENDVMEARYTNTNISGEAYSTGLKFADYMTGSP